jgi:hypothetical protein
MAQRGWETSDALSAADAIQKVDVLNMEVCRVAPVLGRILQKIGCTSADHTNVRQS